MAKAEFELDQYTQGNLIAWNITTQCLNRVNVRLYSGSYEYFNHSKTTSSTDMQMLTLDHTVIHTSDPLILEINVPQSGTLKSSIVAGAISDKKARKVGYIYDICIEDGYDRDYNDVYINIVGWKNQAVNTL